jgi:hypothetical protein
MQSVHDSLHGRLSDVSNRDSDAIGVGVMAEVARILIERDTPIAGSAIFLYNGAEGKRTFCYRYSDLFSRIVC